MNEEKNFFGYVKSINREDKTIEIVASTSEIDRDNEVIEPQAFVQTINSFKSNPVVLSCHQHRLQSGESPVIGSAIPDSIIISDKDLRFKIRFADTSLGENYWRLYRDKHMRACSIGFIPIEGVSKRTNSKDVYHHTKIELLEVSLVPVPSNRQALARAKRLDWLETKKDQHEDGKMLAEIRAEYAEQGRDFDQESNEFAEALLGVGKYANSEAVKSLQDENVDDDEFCDLPDCSALVRGR
jgi:HK97 family phage prohead protease